MNGESGHWDPVLIDLFRSEVETHSETLTTALLAMERAPGDTSHVDQMMRAAHSIKGAARVVGVEPVARVAHVMEDCFVAAQSGTIRLTPADVDVLLRSVDLLGRITTATRDPQTNLHDTFSESVQSVVAELQQVLAGGGSPSVESATPVAPTAVLPATSEVTITFPTILDEAAAEGIRKQFLSAIDSQSQAIRFDLTATQDLDVKGLALLAAAPQHLARTSRASLHLAGVSREMATVLRVTGLAEQFGVSGQMPSGPE